MMPPLLVGTHTSNSQQHASQESLNTSWSIVNLRFGCYMFLYKYTTHFYWHNQQLGTPAYWKVDHTRSHVISLTLLIFDLKLKVSLYSIFLNVYSMGFFFRSLETQ